MTHNDALNKLIEGNKRFTADEPLHIMQDAAKRKAVTENQDPFAVVLSCADSRVVPEFIFDTGLGDLFTVRVAGNVANPTSIAGIEFAVSKLNPKIIVVLGHENCGAVTAAAEGGDYGYIYNQLVYEIMPAVHSCGADAPIPEIVKTNAKLHAEALTHRSRIIDKAAASGKIKIVPAYYNLLSGIVEFL